MKDVLSCSVLFVSWFLTISHAQTNTIDCSSVEFEGLNLAQIINSFNQSDLGLIESVECDNSGFGGKFPAEIALLTNVKSISVAGNKYEGKLPDEISSLTSLESLDVSHNCLTGEVLPLVDNLNMVSLRLDLNKFSGDLDHLADFGSLVEFSARRNDFAGNIPNLTDQLFLQVFVADDNRLDGSVPDFFGELIFLSELKLSDNNLEGKMPPHVANNTDVLPNSKLKKASLTQRWRTFTLPDKCPNRVSFAIKKMFSDALVITAPLVAIAAIMVAGVCAVSIVRFSNQRRSNLEARNNSALSSLFDPKKYKIHVYLSKSSNPGEVILDKIEGLKAMLKDKAIKCSMLRDGEEKVNDMLIMDTAAMIVFLTKDYLEEMRKDGAKCAEEIRVALETGVKVIMVCLEKNLYILAKTMDLLSTGYSLIDMKDEDTVEENFPELFEQLVAAQAEKELAEEQYKNIDM